MDENKLSTYMDINYKSNSHTSKQTKTPKEEKKKLEKVVTGQVTVKKKSGFGKFMSSFVSEDAHDIKSYLFKDVVIPTIKKSITDVIDMILYGGSSKRSRTPGSRVSYGSFYNDSRNTRGDYRAISSYTYDDIILNTRPDAEAVLDQMNDIIDEYQMVSVADLYDLVGLSGNYTDNNYGWTNLSHAGVDRTRDGGYRLKLPRPMPLK